MRRHNSPPVSVPVACIETYRTMAKHARRRHKVTRVNVAGHAGILKSRMFLMRRTDMKTPLVKCPICNSDNVILELADIAADGKDFNKATIPASCNNCFSEWHVNMQITGYDLDSSPDEI